MKNFGRQFFLVMCLVAGITAVKFIWPQAANSGESRAEIVQALEKGFAEFDEFGLFTLLKTEFPAEYEVFLDELIGIAKTDGATAGEISELSFQKGKTFTAGLRKDNAHHALAAPMDMQRAIQENTYAFMREVQGNDALCRKVVHLGPGALTLTDTNHDMVKLLNQGSALVFAAIAEGKKNPQDNDKANDDEITAFVQNWMIQDDVSIGMSNALLSDDIASPDYCQAAISIQKHLLDQTGPLGDRLIVTFNEFSLIE